ncbi:MAG: hypothetical protein AAFQ36_04155 [Pseudomonadota bacterium]
MKFDRSDFLQFRGWVPTVAGRLSFSHVQSINVSRPDYTINDLLSGGIYCSIFAKKNESDSLQGFWTPIRRLWDKLTGKNGNAEFLFILTSSEDLERLKGVILRTYAADTSVELKRLFHATRAIQTSKAPASQVRRLLHKEVTDFLSANSENKKLHFGFVKLFRNGAFHITLPRKRYLAERADDAPRIASSFYRMVRDSTHTHQHHAKTTDTVLNVFEVRTAEPINSWRAEVMYQMMRYAIFSRRSRTSFSLQNSKGVIAYAQSFETLFGLDLFGRRTISKYNFEQITQSLDAAFVSKKTYTDSIPSWVTLASLWLALVGFLSFAFRTFIDQDADSGTILWNLYALVNSNLDYSIAFVFSIPFFIFVFRSRESFFAENGSKIDRFYVAIIRIFVSNFESDSVGFLFRSGIIILLWTIIVYLIKFSLTSLGF